MRLITWAGALARWKFKARDPGEANYLVPGPYYNILQDGYRIQDSIYRIQDTGIKEYKMKECP